MLNFDTVGFIRYSEISILILKLDDKHLPFTQFNPLNAELNPICHLLALLGAHLIFHVSRIGVKATYAK